MSDTYPDRVTFLYLHLISQGRTSDQVMKMLYDPEPETPKAYVRNLTLLKLQAESPKPKP